MNFNNIIIINFVHLLADTSFRSGYYDTAEKLAKHSGIEELSNMTFFSVFRDIEVDINQ